MTFWTRVVRQPQPLWIRRALFQIHLWSGIGLGLYVLMISVTGALIVYRVELSAAFSVKPIKADPKRERLSVDQLKEAALRAFPGSTVTSVGRPRNVTRGITIDLERDGVKKVRVFHPYDGTDLGDAFPPSMRALGWLVDLHDNLLAGRTGQAVNGYGALMLILLSITGMIIWWPGVQRWRRSLSLRWSANWTAFNWDLHSMMGFWTVLFVLLFGVTGLYLSFPTKFLAVVDYITPPTDANFEQRTGDKLMAWLARLHFGRYGGQWMKATWVVMGLAPAVLFVTGTIMWWTRVLRPRLRPASVRSSQPADASAYTPQAPAGS